MAKRKGYRRHKKVKHTEHSTTEPKPKEPEYMVQVNDTNMLRKDILESLREVIIFMQGYEKFRKVQEDKVNAITLLKSDVKEITNLIDNKLRKLLPKGKLAALEPEKKPAEQRSSRTVSEEHEESYEPSVAPAVQPRPQLAPKPSPAASELDALEAQLKDIENQLRSMN